MRSNAGCAVVPGSALVPGAALGFGAACLSGPTGPASFRIRIDPHREYLLTPAAEAGTYLPAALAGGESSGGAPLVHRVELVDLDDEVGLRHQLPREVVGEALDAAPAEVDDLARCHVRPPSQNVR